MNISCSAEPCPVILNSTCVFYTGANLIYTGISTNDNLQLILQKIDNKFKDAGLGYIFQNGVIQLSPGAPVKLGGTLNQNTSIDSNGYTFALTGTIESSAFITTGGTSSQFVKGDGSLDSTSYQPLGNYITALTGDGTAVGPGSAVFTLSNTGVIANTYGSASQVPVITVDAKGRITNVTNTAISYPAALLLFSGDVTGAGVTGANVTLTLNTVNANPYAPITPLKFSVNNKGLVTGASPLTNLDLDTIYGYTPVPQTRTITINGVTQNLSANRTWTIPNTGTVTNVSVTSGTGISASVTNPTTTPNITITNTAPDQTVVLTPGSGISVTGTYPNFTISNTQTSAQWGNITGTITAQTDLITYLSSNYTPLSRTLTINGVTYDLSANRTWTIDSLPSQTGNNGKWLTTDGSTASWQNLPPSGVLSVTASSPLASSGGSNPNISITQANSSTDGYLSSTDWTTFNNKQGTITLTTIGSSGAATFIANTLNIPQYTDQFTGTVTSVGLSMPSAFSVTNSPVTSSGTLTVTGAGLTSQYVRGDGSLANFPANPGGGSSVSYYLNGSVNQGTFGGNVYHQMSRTPVIGGGTNFTLNADGYIANFITDAGDPNLLNIPAGNWDFQMYFSVSSAGGSPRFYTELYKYNGSGFTLISSGSSSPQNITGGTFADVYISTLAVPQTTLSLTDRLAIRVYVIHSGRTITMYTEDNKLAEVHTTFSTGLAALNGLTSQVQYFGTGTSGTDFNISSVTDTHTFNLPTASATNRGALSTGDWSNFNTAYTNRITSLTTTGSSGSATLISNTLNIPTYTLAGLGGQPQLNGTGFVKASGTTITYDNSTYVTSNIYTADGTLSGNRAVTIGTNTLNIGGGLFYVDGTNTRIGVNTATPAQTLDVNGNIIVRGTYVFYAFDLANINNDYIVSNDASYVFLNGNTVGGYIFKHDQPATATQGSGNSVIDAGSVYLNRAGDTNYMAGVLSVGTSSPSSSAQAQIDSTTKGFLPPRMTTVQKNAISSPAQGLILHDTTSDRLNYRDISSWKEVATTADLAPISAAANLFNYYNFY